MIHPGASEDSSFRADNLITLISQWKKTVISITLSALVFSAVISFLIPPKYRSTAVLFPVSNGSIAKSLLTDWEDILRFGEEKEAEQMLQILQSDEIRERVAEKLNLYEHYGISGNSATKRTELRTTFEDLVTFKRTELMSVKIDVLDRNREMAARIANAIIDQMDSTKVRIQKQRALQAFRIVERVFKDKAASVKRLEDSIAFLMKKGVFEYDEQAKVAYREYYKAIARGNQQGAKEMEDRLKNISEYGWAYVALRDNLHDERIVMNQLLTQYERARADIENSLPAKYEVNRAVAAEKKSYPIRWLIVLLSTVSAFIFTVTLITLKKNFASLPGSLNPEKK